MDDVTAIRMAMGGQVVLFCKANPAADPNHAALETRLETSEARGRALAQQALSGERTVTVTVKGKAELKTLIRGNIGVLSGVAQLAGLEESGIEALFRVPREGTAQRKLITAARAMLETVSGKTELFRRHGLPENFVEELSTLVDQYEQTLGTKESGIQAHVGANAELDAVAGEIIKIVNAMDKLNRVRFRKDPEKLAAWEHARNVAWPSPRPDDPTPIEPAA